jgi:hypothetical protein
MPSLSVARGLRAYFRSNLGGTLVGWVTGRCDAVAGYEFKNVQQLARDCEADLFAAAIAQRPGPQR